VTIPAAASRPHTDAVEAALEDAGMLVGRGEQPDGSGWQGEEGRSEFLPYIVLFPSPGTPDGNTAEPYEYLDYKVQATVVAATSEGAEAVTDIVKETLVGLRLHVQDRSSYPMQMLLDSPIRRDDAVTPPLHYAPLQFGARTQPA
jgi:hypothetical protein